jgi:hypothetical protein
LTKFLKMPHRVLDDEGGATHRREESESGVAGVFKSLFPRKKNAEKVEELEEGDEHAEKKRINDEETNWLVLPKGRRRRRRRRKTFLCRRGGQARENEKHTVPLKNGF